MSSHLNESSERQDAGRDENKEARLQRVSQILQEILKYLNVSAAIRIREEEKRIFIDLDGSDLGRVIGKGGTVLDALQTYLEAIINQKVDKRISLTVDAQHYRKRKEERLINWAKELAKKVEETKKEITLEPLSAWERRIIHIALKEHPAVSTISVGEGEERRLKICLRKEKPETV